MLVLDIFSYIWRCAFQKFRCQIVDIKNQSSKLGQDIIGGRIYAPVVVAQGSLIDFVNNNPTNGGDANDIHAYFNFVGANPDGVDHLKLLGNNTFGVEDMYGGGDRDFNDLVVNMNIKLVQLFNINLDLTIIIKFILHRGGCKTPALIYVDSLRF